MKKKLTKKEMEKRLQKIDKNNRDRSNKYLNKIKKDGKQQISAILSSKAYKELTRLRDVSIKSGKQLSYGDIIESVLFHGVNTNDKLNDKLDVDTNDNIDINTNSKLNVNIDKKKIPNWKTQRPEYREFLKEILLSLEPVKWREQAELLNEKGILTSRGKQWTVASLPLMIKRFKKDAL